MKDWIIPYMKQHKWPMILSLLFGAIGIISGAMLMFVSGYLISKSSLQPYNIMVVYVPIVSVRAFSISQAAFAYTEKLASHHFVLRILESMRTKLYRIVEPQALFLRSRYQTGDLLGVLSDDIEHLQDLYIRTILPSVLGTLIYGIVIGVLGIFDWPFALMMALVLGVIVFLIPIISFHKTRVHHPKLQKTRQYMYARFSDAIFGLTDWFASGRQNELFADVAEEERESVKTEKAIQRWHHIRAVLFQIVIGIAVILMIIWSSHMTDQNIISPTLIAAFTLMTLSITDALTPVSEAVEQVPSYIESIERMRTIEGTKGQADERDHVLYEDLPNYDLTITNVSYRYPKEHTRVLDGISLHIPQGKKIAVLGKSGTGKSTLLKLLAGVITPTDGSINIGGQTMHQGLLSQAVSVLDQKPHLFATTVKNNIRIGRPDATDEEIIEAATKAQLRPLIESLPKGLDTQMHEMGSRFSGGERQRVAFARVLLQNTPIILIDEATVGLDPNTERSLIETILEAATDKTIIWVTHHLAGLETMDEIIFLNDGKITMQGNHNDLWTHNKTYQRLYEMDRGLT